MKFNIKLSIAGFSLINKNCKILAFDAIKYTINCAWILPFIFKEKFSKFDFSPRKSCKGRINLLLEALDLSVYTDCAKINK